MSERPREPDTLDVASGVSLAISDSPDLHEMLSVVARRVAEALGVWECDIYEYRPETDDLVALALWSPQLGDADRDWLGTAYSVADRPSYELLLRERAVREYQVDDASLRAEDAEVMRRWGELSVLSVPLVFQDDVIGALTLVETRAPRRFSPDDLRLLEILAVPAAVAVYNARMFRREAEQNRRLQALLAASRAVNSTIHLDELLATVVRAARAALDTAQAAIDTYDPANDSITVVAYDTRDPEPGAEQFLGRTYQLADYPADREMLLSGEIGEEHVSDPALDERNRRSMLENGEKAMLTIPLVYEGTPMGLLVLIETEMERHFTREERELAAALGEQAAAAIHHAELLERTERQNRQLGLLLESTRAISRSYELDEVLAIVARTTAEALGAEQCQIQEYDGAENTVTPVAFWQRHRERPEPDSMHQTFSLANEPEERAFLESKQVVQQLYSDPEIAKPTRAIMNKYGDLSYLNVPLVFGDQSFGVMVLVETEVERRWGDDEVALARALGEQAAVAIEHARLYRHVQDQAITDGLTRLFNHRYFYERLEQEIARAKRYGTPVSLLMIDLDDFKLFNDRHGHLAGDAVLREMAKVLGSELRAKLDIAARYGGEEFAIILPNTPMAAVPETQMEMDLAGKLTKAGDANAPPAPGHRHGAEEVAERIRRRVGATHFTASDGKRLSRLTVSIGVAVFPHKTSSPEDLVGNADAALYKAKRAGKDRVETYG
ncbi:MAG: sensor domain-containing diguanylate cyclase [Actinobacteria bacterium]|nr:sensor domain-containing diguanylate cyclase [Actinomycetota bacterium]